MLSVHRLSCIYFTPPAPEFYVVHSMYKYTYGVWKCIQVFPMSPGGSISITLTFILRVKVHHSFNNSFLIATMCHFAIGIFSFQFSAEISSRYKIYVRFYFRVVHFKVNSKHGFFIFIENLHLNIIRIFHLYLFNFLRGWESLSPPVNIYRFQEGRKILGFPSMLMIGR